MRIKVFWPITSICKIWNPFRFRNRRGRIIKDIKSRNKSDELTKRLHRQRIAKGEDTKKCFSIQAKRSLNIGRTVG